MTANTGTSHAIISDFQHVKRIVCKIGINAVTAVVALGIIAGVVYGGIVVHDGLNTGTLNAALAAGKNTFSDGDTVYKIRCGNDGTANANPLYVDNNGNIAVGEDDYLFLSGVPAARSRSLLTNGFGTK